jgi:hypothetical protein
MTMTMVTTASMIGGMMILTMMMKMMMTMMKMMLIMMMIMMMIMMDDHDHDHHDHDHHDHDGVLSAMAYFFRIQCRRRMCRRLEADYWNFPTQSACA